MTVQSDWAVLTDEQQQFFEDNGYLLIEDALPPDVVAELNAATDEIYDREKAADRLEKAGKLNLRNCIVHHDAFLQLLDWPTTAPLAWQILNWNIQMITSHLIVLPSGPEPSEE
ncbi:MAG: phytanoyl-CoA dioxygenase family protein, partial [Gemmatimonadota bacterium]|nr:phytanoyl-CoA dioxygenase family protein [Gemmatimonadota bacterium]